MVYIDLNDEPFYVISDTHLHHFKLMKFYCNRPFDTVEEMNEVIIENWQNAMKTGKAKKIFFLGDFVCGCGNKKYTEAQRIYDLLLGEKVFIKGNHDRDINKLTSINAIDDQIEVKYKGYRILMTHEPVYNFDQDIQIFGHVHNNQRDNFYFNKGKFMYNVCPEVNDYKPVFIEDILLKRQELSKKYLTN